jgi:hypothetical protein
MLRNLRVLIRADRHPLMREQRCIFMTNSCKNLKLRENFIWNVKHCHRVTSKQIKMLPVKF